MRSFIEIPIFPQPIISLVTAGEELRVGLEERADRGRQLVKQMETALADLILLPNDGLREKVVRDDSAGSERLEFDGGWLGRLGVPAELMIEADLALAGTKVLVFEAGEAAAKNCVDVGRAVSAFARVQAAGRRSARRQDMILDCRQRLEIEREETEGRRQFLIPIGENLKRRTADLKVFERRALGSVAADVAAGRNYLPDWVVRAGLVSGQKQEGVRDLRVRDAREETTWQEELLTFVAGLVSLSSP